MNTTCLCETGSRTHQDRLAGHILTLCHSEDMAAVPLLREYICSALKIMTESPYPETFLRLAAATLEASMRLSLPQAEKAARFLISSIRESKKNALLDIRELILPLLTLSLFTGDPKPRREASRIINRSYSNLKEEETLVNTDEVADRIYDLLTAVTFSDYVKRFSIRKIGNCWNSIARHLLSFNHDSESREVDRLLIIAEKISQYTPLSPTLKSRLKAS